MNCQSRRHRSIESIISSAGCIAGNTFALGRRRYSPVFILQGTLIPRKLSTELRIDHSHAKLVGPNVLPFFVCFVSELLTRLGVFTLKRETLSLCFGKGILRRYSLCVL